MARGREPVAHWRGLAAPPPEPAAPSRDLRRASTRRTQRQTAGQVAWALSWRHRYLKSSGGERDLTLANNHAQLHCERPVNRPFMPQAGEFQPILPLQWGQCSDTNHSCRGGPGGGRSKRRDRTRAFYSGVDPPTVIARLDPKSGLPGLTRSRACPTSALNCRNRKHPISMQSSIHGRWLLDRPVNPPIKSGEGDDSVASVNAHRKGVSAP